MTHLLLLASALCWGQMPSASLKEALTFHAAFDGKTDADLALGDRRIYFAPSYKAQREARAGLGDSPVELASGQGRFGDALRFREKNTRAIFYQAHRNVAFHSSNWSGTVSFWLRLDPDQDLAPGYCDPIQITDKAYNDSAIWVDFTKDERPRHFRLGVFGELKAWNPANLPSDKNPDFLNRLVVVQKPPFSRNGWTNVVITFQGLGSGNGWSKLYLNGVLQGEAGKIREKFFWDPALAAVRLGVSYVGFFDELAIFNRALADTEVTALYRLARGVGELYAGAGR
ncbi:MAG: LamG domain-containing protein [Bryobacteraceae bacterium]|nr:LamG domain-containing protein [Bryobacteraceae bacterium]MDW8377631.1 LamG-like jellyroll fold domain-containing protein [Bryobacterales bacterium]